MFGLNGTWAWLPQREQTTAKYSRGPPFPPRPRPNRRRRRAWFAGPLDSSGIAWGLRRTPSSCSTPGPRPSGRTRRRSQHRSGFDRRRTRFSSGAAGSEPPVPGQGEPNLSPAARRRCWRLGGSGRQSAVLACLSGTHRQGGRIPCKPVAPDRASSIVGQGETRPPQPSTSLRRASWNLAQSPRRIRPSHNGGRQVQAL